jgi:hypothetical protein
MQIPADPEFLTESYEFGVWRSELGDRKAP